MSNSLIRLLIGLRKCMQHVEVALEYPDVSVIYLDIKSIVGNVQVSSLCHVTRDSTPLLRKQVSSRCKCVSVILPMRYLISIDAGSVTEFITNHFIHVHTVGLSESFHPEYVDMILEVTTGEIGHFNRTSSQKMSFISVSLDLDPMRSPDEITSLTIVCSSAQKVHSGIMSRLFSQTTPNCKHYDLIRSRLVKAKSRPSTRLSCTHARVYQSR